MKKIFIIVLTLLILSCTKKVEAPAPYGPTPSENQLNWQEMEYYGLVCYGLNTYTRQEWGYGDVDPGVFKPSNLDTDQWARVSKESGMKGLILVAKHHDGFCLWPSKTTDYSVAATSWKDGKGDVLGDLAKSCKKYGLKLGVYISPWDRNHAGYGKQEYVEAYHEQWREVLGYSDDIWETWFDGANGGTGYYGGARESRTIKKGYYQFPKIFKLIKEKQPKAIFFGYVEDVTEDVVRWGGTEDGSGSETNWSTFFKASNPNWSEDIARKGVKGGKYWIPVEGNTTILHPKKWYYNESSKPRTLKNFVDLYYSTIGQNATFLLGLSIGPDGLIPERDVKSMLAQKKQIDRELANNLLKGATVTADNFRGKNFLPQNGIDGLTTTYWATKDSIHKSNLTIDFGKPTIFNRLLLQEYIKLGQRIHKFSVKIEDEQGWKEVAHGTTIGYKRIIRFNNVSSNKVKITFETDAPCIAISNIEIYNAPPLLAEPVISSDKNGTVTLSAPDGLDIYYAISETPSDKDFKEYKKPFNLPVGGTVSAYTQHKESGNICDIISEKFGIAKTKWKIHSIHGKAIDDSLPANVFDGKSNTLCVLDNKNEKHPHLVIDLGEIVDIKGFGYLPPELGSSGIIFEYEFYTSLDGVNWGNPISSGEFSNIENNPIRQIIRFKEAKEGKFIKFVSKSTVKQEGKTSIAEIEVF